MQGRTVQSAKDNGYLSLLGNVINRALLDYDMSLKKENTEQIKTDARDFIETDRLEKFCKYWKLPIHADAIRREHNKIRKIK